jgi:trigger factor
MQVNVQRISPVVMEVEVEVPADIVRAEIDKAYVNLGKKAHVRGFRPGKVPRNVLTQLFAPQVHSDVMNAIVNNTLPKALEEKSVTPVSQPAVEAGKVEANAVFSYKARFEVQPEIDGGTVKYEGFELTRPRTTADEKLVEDQLEGLRLRHARLEAPSPARVAKTGDVLTIDFTLSVDGKAMKDGGGEGVQLELGSGQVLPDLDKALQGKSVDEKFETDAAFPDNHPSKELAGKSARFAVTVKDVKEKVLPKLDDEFAKDVGQYQTLVELRADIHTKLEKALKDQAEAALAEQIVQKLNDANPLDVPPSLVEQQARIMEQELAQQARRVGQRFTQEQAQTLQAKIREDAEKKVRAGLLMAAIAKKHEFKVTDEDIEKGLGELAQETGKNVAKLKVEYRDQGKRNMLIGMILEDKILDFLEGKSKISDAPVGGVPDVKEEVEGKGEKKSKKKDDK